MIDDDFVFRSLDEFKKPDQITLSAAQVEPTKERLLKTDPGLFDRLKARSTARLTGNDDRLTNFRSFFFGI